MTVKERIKKYIEFKGISIRSFCRSSGLSESYVTSIRHSIQPSKLDMIAENFTDLSMGWVVTGEGPMIKERENLAGDCEALCDATMLMFNEKLNEMIEIGEFKSSSLALKQTKIIRDLYTKMIGLENEIIELNKTIVKLKTANSNVMQL